ncbi:hypothetical protein TNCV_1852621 [Trichonephila clavipes]|nr:hypothetical protein TNCV_1852621 [Trichonephila clavipes]
MKRWYLQVGGITWRPTGFSQGQLNFPNHEKRRDWDVRRRFTDVRRNRNWTDAKVFNRQDYRRDNCRSTYGNGLRRNQGFENRNRIDRDNRGFESRNGQYQFRNRSPRENFYRGDRRQGGRLNCLKVRVDQDNQSQNERSPPIRLSDLCMSPVELPNVPILLN